MSDTGKAVDAALAHLKQLDADVRVAELGVLCAAETLARFYHREDSQLETLRQDVEKMLAARAAHSAYITNVYAPSLTAHYSQTPRGSNAQ